MSSRVRDIVTVCALVMVLLAAFLVLRALRRGGSGAPETGSAPVVTPSADPTPPGDSASHTTAGQQPPAVAAAAGEVAPGGDPAAAVTAADGAPATGTETKPTEWRRRPPADFTGEDLAQCGRGVELALGDYEARVGKEFTVTVSISAPALESLTLAVQFDRESLALVPGSAAPVGPQFRGGIECYAGKAGGSLVVIHAGTPGKKNVDGGTGGTALTWRMRALRPGTAQLTVLPQSSFTSARGEDESYEVSGGSVNVR